MCVCVQSFGVMWKCGELNGSGISPVLWPVTYGPAHDRQGTPCFICGQRGLFTLLFQLFLPPASSFLSFSIRLFYLNPIRALTRPPSAVLPAAMQRFTDSFLSESLSREVFAIPLPATPLFHIYGPHSWNTNFCLNCKTVPILIYLFIYLQTPWLTDSNCHCKKKN